MDARRLGDLVEHFYRAFLAADREALAKFVAAEAAPIVRLDTPPSGAHRGPDGIASLRRRIDELTGGTWRPLREDSFDIATSPWHAVIMDRFLAERGERRLDSTLTRPSSWPLKTAASRGSSIPSRPSCFRGLLVALTGKPGACYRSPRRCRDRHEEGNRTLSNGMGNALWHQRSSQAPGGSIVSRALRSYPGASGARRGRLVPGQDRRDPRGRVLSLCLVPEALVLDRLNDAGKRCDRLPPGARSAVVIGIVEQDHVPAAKTASHLRSD